MLKQDSMEVKLSFELCPFWLTMSRGILFAKMNFEGWGEVGGAGESEVDGLGVWKGQV